MFLAEATAVAKALKRKRPCVLGEAKRELDTSKWGGAWPERSVRSAQLRNPDWIVFPRKGVLVFT